LLSESEVLRSFNRLFQDGKPLPDTFEKAEQLLDELRYESPLRHRLNTELEELRTRAQNGGVTVKAKPKPRAKAKPKTSTKAKA
jgi:hypothetical protein